jgi:hypothetical protein
MHVETTITVVDCAKVYDKKGSLLLLFYASFIFESQKNLQSQKSFAGIYKKTRFRTLFY